MTDFANLGKLQHFFIGSKELAHKFTGLCRLRVSFLINCSNEPSDMMPIDKTIKTIIIPQDLRLSSNEINLSITDFFNNVNLKQKIMIYSDDINKSRLTYCCIAIRYLQVHLNILIQEFKNRSVDKHTLENKLPFVEYLI